MKKLIIILLLLMAVPASGANIAGLLGGSPPASAPAGDCPSGTYMAYWTGDHSSGETYWCLNSGASSANASASSGTSFSTEGSSKIVTYTTKDAYIAYAITSSEWNENEGTMWIRVYVDTVSANFYFFELYNTGSAGNSTVLNWINASTAIQVTRVGGGATDTLTSAAVSTGAWLDIGVSWSVGRGTIDWSLTVDKGETWEDDGVDGIATMAAAPNILRLGNLDESSNNSTYKIDSFVSLAGWRTACPW